MREKEELMKEINATAVEWADASDKKERIKLEVMIDIRDDLHLIAQHLQRHNNIIQGR